ncbi:insulin-like growth factor 2 mRNA-binding protein 3 [Homalodisca vitripennis]|uniref:insulin-like growth factor 2 mRNA-binding protein 3 n=1 Tax=Homalodisca vitripennis TaxID=197043 RepID=UPI001EEB5BAF|nr:insulin-like growth factor 2 mRNA-binding protein 3 [Homalodisca vitripennis]
MSKLYVGNLPSDINEATLRQLFLDNNLPCGTILIKRGGYAFVDCADQSIADKAIDQLNGANFLGTQIQVEPSVAGTTRKRSPVQSGGDQMVKS